MRELHNIGTIATLRLPEGWVEGPAEPIIGGRECRKFYPETSPDVFFLSQIRHVPVSQSAAVAFQNSLYAEFHSLSVEEITSLDEVLEALSNQRSFSIKEAATGYLNGRRAILASGQWIEGQTQAIAALIDINGDGQLVHQLYCSAPKDKFETVESEFRSILNSIEWQK